jgi:hypothetical protein
MSKSVIMTVSAFAILSCPALAVEANPQHLKAFTQAVKQYTKPEGLQRLEGTRQLAVTRQNQSLHKPFVDRPSALKIYVGAKFVERLTKECAGVKKGDFFVCPPFDVRKVGGIGQLPEPATGLLTKKISDNEALVEIKSETNVLKDGGPEVDFVVTKVHFKGFDFKASQEGQRTPPIDEWVYVSCIEDSLPVLEPLEIPAEEQGFFKRLITITAWETP